MDPILHTISNESCNPIVDFSMKRKSLASLQKPNQLPQLDQSTMPKSIHKRDIMSISRDNETDVRVRTMKHKRLTCPVSMQLPEMDINISQCVTPKKREIPFSEEE
jgi:hypothetical protein